MDPQPLIFRLWKEPPWLLLMLQDICVSFIEQSALAAYFIFTTVLVREYLVRGFLAKGVPDASAAIYPSAALLKAVAISGSFSLKVRERYENGDYLPQILGEAPDPYQGFGRLKLNHVLYFPDYTGNHKTIIPRDENGNDPVLSQDGIDEYCFQTTVLNSSYPPRFTLTWTDFPAQPTSSISLVQDLDLLVLVGNTTYYANGGSDLDSINNVERTQLPGTIPDNMTIKVQVIGTFLPVDERQAYALVATGPIIEVGCDGANSPRNVPSSEPSSSSHSYRSFRYFWTSIMLIVLCSIILI